MKGQKVRHYVTGGFKSHRQFLREETYGLLMDNVVRGCVDVIIADEEGGILLGNRRLKHWGGWWSFGGAIVPGERPEEAAARIIKKDLCLAVLPERFVFINVVSLLSGIRQTPPQNHGCADIVLYHFLLVKKEEVPLIKIGNPIELMGMVWVRSEVDLKEMKLHSPLEDIIDEVRAFCVKSGQP